MQLQPQLSQRERDAIPHFGLCSAYCSASHTGDAIMVSDFRRSAVVVVVVVVVGAAAAAAAAAEVAVFAVTPGPGSPAEAAGVGESQESRARLNPHVLLKDEVPLPAEAGSA